MYKTNPSRLPFSLRFLAKAGFSPDQSAILLSLVDNGPQTILRLAQSSRVERTRVHRGVSELVKFGYVEELRYGKRPLYKIGDLEEFRVLVAEAESDAVFLKESFPSFAGLVKSGSLGVPAVGRQYFGREGVRQMLWGMFEAGNEGVGYTGIDMGALLGEVFVRQWLNECLRRQFQFRNLANPPVSPAKPAAMLPAGFAQRYVSATDLPILFNLDIVGGKIFVYELAGKEVWGYVIASPAMAVMQRHLFDSLWEKAKEL